MESLQAAFSNQLRHLVTGKSGSDDGLSGTFVLDLTGPVSLEQLLGCIRAHYEPFSLELRQDSSKGSRFTCRLWRNGYIVTSIMIVIQSKRVTITLRPPVLPRPSRPKSTPEHRPLP